MRLVVAPKEDFQAQFTQFNSLPTFEHREEVALVTDELFETPEEAKRPNPAMVMKKSGMPGGPGVLVRAATTDSSQSGGSTSPGAGDGSIRHGRQPTAGYPGGWGSPPAADNSFGSMGRNTRR